MERKLPVICSAKRFIYRGNKSSVFFPLFLLRLWRILHQRSSGWQPASRVRSVRRAPPPPLTARGCLETSLERRAGCWIKARRGFGVTFTSCLLLTSCRFFPNSAPWHYPPSRQNSHSRPGAEIGGFLALAMQNRVNLNFKTWVLRWLSRLTGSACFGGRLASAISCCWWGGIIDSNLWRL